MVVKQKITVDYFAYLNLIKTNCSFETILSHKSD